MLQVSGQSSGQTLLTTFNAELRIAVTTAKLFREASQTDYPGRHTIVTKTAARAHGQARERPDSHQARRGYAMGS